MKKIDNNSRSTDKKKIDHSKTLDEIMAVIFLAVYFFGFLLWLYNIININ